MKTKERRHTKDIHQQLTLSIFITPTDSNIGKTGATSLSESLKSNTTLTELDLSGQYKRKKAQKTFICNSLFSILFMSTDNNIGETGAKSLSEVLKSNRVLTKLNLSRKCKKKIQKKSINNSIFSFSSHQQTTPLEKRE